MHSIINMIRNRRKKKFPILRLPFLAIEEIFKTMDPIEITNFSMISKRTRAVAKLMSFYSKYSIHLFFENSTLYIGLYGTKESVSCTYVMTSDEKINGKVEEWKQFCINLLETFKKQTIDVLTMQMDADVDHSVSFIDFLKTNVKSVNECYLYQWDQQYNVEEDFAYLLNNITINNMLDSRLYIKNYYFDGKIPKNLKELYIHNSQWIGYERLMEIDCKSVILEENRISDEQWNIFLKKWITMETHLNLEYLHLDHRDLEEFRALVLHDIPHEVVDEAVKRTVRVTDNKTEEISGGIDIRRIDGKTATFFVYRPFYSQYLAMSIH